MSDTTQFFPGQQLPSTPSSDYNVQHFHMLRMLHRVSTATLCKVEKCSNSGGLAATGTVNVTPLVNLQDGQGKQYKHVQMFNLPYFRLQGGSDKAVILDPKVGDIGVAVFADRDISTVKQTKKQGPAGSRRRFSMADGLFFPCFLGDKPTTYVRFTDNNKIYMVRPGDICCVVTDKCVQIKKKGGVHVTADIANGKIVMSSTPEIGPDPYPNEPET